MSPRPPDSRRGTGPGRGRGAGSRQGRPRQPSIEWLAELLEQGGIHLNPTQLQQLWHFHSLLREGNRDRDLTRIIGFEAIVIKHYVDCMFVGKLVTLPSPLLDVGTGAGFPGIPLKIRYPHLRMTLAEPRPRRVEFLKNVIQALPLHHVDVFDHRVVSRSFSRPVAGVITRAVEPIEKTLLRTSACTGVGSQLIFMKGPAVAPELASALARLGDQYRLLLDKPYTLPGTSHDRRLIVLERLIPAAVSETGDNDEEAAENSESDLPPE